MDLRLLPSAFHGDPGSDSVPPAQPLTSYLISGANGAGPLAVDAGSLGLVGEPADMALVRGLVLTHSHIDHVATLPMWIEARLSMDLAPVLVHASEATIATLRSHLFNGHLFPDFEALKALDGRPCSRFVPMPIEEDFELAGFTLRAFEVQHPVPTHGLLVDDGAVSVVIGSDSGPTERLWEVARSAPHVRAIVIETSFPDRLVGIAKSSGHLTPERLADELEKAPEGVRILVTHLKPAYRAEVVRAIRRLGDRRIEILVAGETVVID